MITITDAQVIASLFYLLDSGVRHDLFNSRIADERDYVSRMVTHFNYPFGILNHYFFNHIKFQSKWFARINSGHYEQKFGCDSMITFKVGNKIKVGLFEAKWPRVLNDPNYNWDYTQKSSKTSHFTNQIERQAKWTNQAAIWEMFFYEGKVGANTSPFDENASTCIRHDFAKALVNTTASLKTMWDNNDLNTLIKSEQTSAFNGSNETNIKSIIYDILTCSFGQVINVTPSDRTFTLISFDGKDSARCPIITAFDDNDNNQLIQGFMAENGLSFFLQLNIATPNNGEE